MDISKEKKVRDVMTLGVVTVSYDMPVSKIVKLLVNEAISGVAVTAPDNKVVGVISEIDIVKNFDKDWTSATAEEVMSSIVRTIGPEMSLRKAAEIMRDLNIHRLLILSVSPAPEIPIGILTASDILKASAQ